MLFSGIKCIPRQWWVRFPVRSCHGTVLSDKRPQAIFAAPRPRRGRYFLPPRDPSDPATLPTLVSIDRYSSLLLLSFSPFPSLSSSLLSPLFLTPPIFSSFPPHLPPHLPTVLPTSLPTSQPPSLPTSLVHAPLFSAAPLPQVALSHALTLALQDISPEH